MFVKKLYRSVRAEDAALFTLSFLWICVIIQCVFLSGTDTRSVSAQAAGSPPVLILDPGHGGADGGAVAPDGTAESALNLSVALRVRDLCAFFGVDTVMTRDTEEITYPSEAKTIAAMKKWDTRRRVEIAESVDSPVFLSIHQNIYPSSGPHGSQVLYAQNPAALWPNSSNPGSPRRCCRKTGASRCRQGRTFTLCPTFNVPPCWSSADSFRIRRSYRFCKARTIRKRSRPS